MHNYHENPLKFFVMFGFCFCFLLMQIQNWFGRETQESRVFTISWGGGGGFIQYCVLGKYRDEYKRSSFPLPFSKKRPLRVNLLKMETWITE